ncbi:MAG: FoF1 ATP synthase subunit gamma [Nitrospira sp.]
MSKRREIEEHIRTLGEIEGIMGAMKNLSLMESHKLNRRLDTQQRVVSDIETAGRDFLSFYPGFLPSVSGKDLYLVIGTERGFCGEFNDHLLSALDGHLRTVDDRNPSIFIVGRKLLQRAEQRYRLVGTMEGPTVAEDVPPILGRVIDQVRSISSRQIPKRSVSVTIVAHDASTEAVVVRPLRPFHADSTAADTEPFPPQLTLPPADFFTQLVDLYLFSLLHATFYSALLAESRARLAHLEAALRRLEDNRAGLLRKRNLIRQEEITEEIEVLMLSTVMEPRRR